MNKKCKICNIFIMFIAVLGCLLYGCLGCCTVLAQEESEDDSIGVGGGYVVTGQISDSSYTSRMYDASNGLSASEVMFLLSTKDGYLWVGGYSGVMRYDGATFERLDSESGLTSARGMFEDSRGRIWFGTNDNGVVVIDGEERRQFTIDDGLPSSSIRAFEEDNSGNIVIGTTQGLCYVDAANMLHVLDDGRINKERILKLDKDASGIIYGHTSNGLIFTVDDCIVTNVYDSFSHYNMGEKITTILVDPNNEGMIYVGTAKGRVYYGKFGDNKRNLKIIEAEGLGEIHWLCYACNRVWVTSTEKAGYIEDDNFVMLGDIPMNSGIEMMTADYQGNMWFASSTQGIMEVVANNFVDISGKAGLPAEVTNVSCKYNGNIYLGTDNGLRILDNSGKLIENKLTDYIGEARVRCFTEDLDGNLWIGTYTYDMGMVCYKANGDIISLTMSDGMPSDQIRCSTLSSDGRVIVGTDNGIAIIRDGSVISTITTDNGFPNTVISDVMESKEGLIFISTDGEGIYVIGDGIFDRIDTESGLTSDIVRTTVNDEKNECIWIVTSNSIEYMKAGVITQVKTFPFNDNYDIHLSDTGEAWILSSYGIYVVNSDDMINDDITDYRHYTMENGMPYSITRKASAYYDQDGGVYIPGRGGVIGLNTNHFFERNAVLLVNLKSVTCDKKKCDIEDGAYKIPASKGRIQINAAVMDFTMMNPMLHVFLEGGPDDGVICQRSELTPLEYTDLPYGNYTFHVQILSGNGQEILQDNTFRIIKAPGLFELISIRFMLLLVLAAITGVLVWWIMHTTVISRQYAEIRAAKEEAENANSAKTRFLANISHEIRTPINTIMGMNEMLMREDAANVPKGYFLSVMNYSLDIRNASESLLSLINELLDMSKIESGKMHLVEQDYDSQEMIRSIVSMIRMRSTEKGLSFDVVVDEMLPVRMYGDSGKIKQVVINLLSNALKYTKMGGFCLNVSMEERVNNVATLRFSVKDTGMGIKEEDMDKLFTAYERLDEEKNSAIQGTGLGLDISRRFSELMGGKLWCESVYGEGSEFILVVEQKIIDPKPLGAFVEHDEKVKGPYKPKFVAPDADILVVDDNPMNLNVIKGLLKATKVFVTTSESGEDAIDKIKDNHYDVVFLDHMMPGMDGVETLKVIRASHPDLPVYALTANTASGEDFYKSKGFNGYLSKPVESESLETTIMKHLPENKMEKATDEDAVEELTEMPENMLWIYDVEELTVSEGLTNSGGIENYLFSLELFVDTIEENSKVLKDAIESENIRLFTIKVHALKSSARIIGAMELSGYAAELEAAGNKNDIAFIMNNTEKFLSDYESFKDKLARIKNKPGSDSEKEPIPEEELKDAYEALTDFIPQMDYDSVEMIIDSVLEYKLPENDEHKFNELERLLRKFDWDEMERVISK